MLQQSYSGKEFIPKGSNFSCSCKSNNQPMKGSPRSSFQLFHALPVAGFTALMAISISMKSSSLKPQPRNEGRLADVLGKRQMQQMSCQRQLSEKTDKAEKRWESDYILAGLF